MEFSINTVGKIVLVVLVVSLVLVALTIVWDTTWQDAGDEGPAELMTWNACSQIGKMQMNA